MEFIIFQWGYQVCLSRIPKSTERDLLSLHMTTRQDINLSGMWYVAAHTLQSVETIVEMLSVRAFCTDFEAWAVKCRNSGGYWLRWLRAFSVIQTQNIAWKCTILITREYASCIALFSTPASPSHFVEERKSVFAFSIRWFEHANLWWPPSILAWSIFAKFVGEPCNTNDILIQLI